METITDPAEKLIQRLRDNSSDSNQTDQELVTNALRSHPDIDEIVCIALVLFYTVKRTMPEYESLAFIVIMAMAAVGCWFARRGVKELEAV